MADPKSPRLPPRWFVRAAWVVHRAIYRLTPGRFGIWPAKPGKWGTMRLHTTGRRSGQTRTAMLGYFEDGPNLVTLAMNGWAAPEPAWWLNLRAQPDATVDLPDRSVPVRGRAAEGEGSASASGPDGRSTATTSTATPPGGRPRLPWSSSRREPTSNVSLAGSNLIFEDRGSHALKGVPGEWRIHAVA